MKKLLFVCNANLHRSPKAEKIFKDKYKTQSAGVGELAEQQLTSKLLEWG